MEKKDLWHGAVASTCCVPSWCQPCVSWPLPWPRGPGLPLFAPFKMTNGSHLCLLYLLVLEYVDASNQCFQSVDSQVPPVK